MKHRTHLVLLASLVTGTAWGMDVNATSTTFAQAWQQNRTGFSQSNYSPVTEYVAIDATGLGNPAISMHLYGWGLKDLGDPSSVYGKNTGDLTYGYLQYDFGRANAQLKAGRFTVNQGVGNELVDGVSARTDLRWGFAVSAFGGAPVVYKNNGPNQQSNIAYQHDVIFGGRLAWRAGKYGEIGVSALEDGSQPAYDLVPAQPVDYTRRQMGVDLRMMPVAWFDFSGRTVFDIADHPQPAPGVDNSRIAEHDYKATARLSEQASLTGTYVERNLFAYYAGSTLPTLFNQNEQGMFKATGASLTWNPKASLQVVADLRRTERAAYGDATRFGADLRWTFPDSHLLAGAGFHQVDAFSVVAVAPLVPAYSLSHNELRAWVMAQRGTLSASLDGILLHYADGPGNPELNGKSSESALVGSLGYQAKENLKVTGNLTLDDSPVNGRQVLGLVRVDYRFGSAAKGGK
jgi:hypothetical protein